MIRSLIAAIVTATLAGAAAAQAPTQPYGALKDRPIKALSADDVTGLRAGRGMSMALPAELNRYPGPMHVLDHATALGLSLDQKQKLGQHVETMRADAMALGEQIIKRERALDSLFRSGAADASAVDRITSEIATLYGRLRAAHLRAHVETRATLTDPQVALYQTIRGYDNAGPNPTHKH
jgi:hypothetical protein